MNMSKKPNYAFVRQLEVLINQLEKIK